MSASLTLELRPVVGGKLDSALAWAARGLRVFPLQADSKLPLEIGWTVSATTDPDVIRAIWTDPVVGAERNYNIGVLTSDLIAVDVDVKAGKPGLATMLRLGLEFDTLTVRTPTGGFHLYYRAIGREVGNAPLGPGLDVRSHHGYLLAPGSTINGIPYTVEIDEPVADFPVELRPLLKAPRSRRDASGVSVELDLPEALELAAHWLRREAPIAVQGENGDAATYKVACRVRDFGVSECAALDLMLDEWNDRCEPPWSVHEVRLKVENAYRYATGQAGSASPAALFDSVVDVLLPSTTPTGGQSERGDRVDLEPADGNAPLHQPPMASEEALALRYAADHADDLRYVAKWSQWMIWRDGRWQEDATLRALDMARALCREAAAGCNEARVATILASAKTIYAIQNLARSDRGVAATVDQWDADRDLLDTPGGAVNLHTGAMRPHDRRDYCTKITVVTPAAPGTLYPQWMRFLRRVTRDDEALIAYLQRVAGYCLTGSVKENALFFAYGTGRNGKGVFINTLTRVMGGYAAIAGMETFVASRTPQHPTDLAGLRGARLVSAQETEEGRTWAEAKIKTLTGGDPITARFMRNDFFTYEPQFKLLIAGNHRPSLRSVDEAIRARFNLIPFTVFIPENERDPDLSEKLKAEWPAILRWAVDGCLQWRQIGLAPPDAVRMATKEYLAEEDAFTLWLEECCERSGGAWESATNLYASWKRWAERAGEEVGTQKRLSQILKGQFVDKRQGGTGKAGFDGLRLKTAQLEVAALM